MSQQQPKPGTQARDVIASVATRLNRTPSQPLDQTELVIHINETVYDNHPGTHPDALIPQVRAALPELPSDSTCGEYARTLRETSRGQR